MENVKKVTIKRVSDENGATLGIIYFDGIAICGNIEPTETHGEKISSGNRVQEGIYKLGLRDEGGYNQRYREKYNNSTSKNYKEIDWHQGMLCVYNAPDWKIECKNGRSFQYVLFHTGNTKNHTKACSLPNYILNFLSDTGNMSGTAYANIYPQLRDSILASEKGYIEIEYIDIEEGR